MVMEIHGVDESFCFDYSTLVKNCESCFSLIAILLLVLALGLLNLWIELNGLLEGTLIFSVLTGFYLIGV